MHGHDVVVFDRRGKPGGLNEYGIAAYKVPHGFASFPGASAAGPQQRWELVSELRRHLGVALA